MASIDYSTYSLDELNEAKRFINKNKYPENYQALLTEFESREPEIEDGKDKSGIIKARQEELKKEKKKVFVLGLIQVFSALCLAYLGYKEVSANQFGNLLLIALIFIFVCFNAVCGYTLLTKQKKWYWLSLVNQGLQIPNVALGKFVFSYTAVGTVFIGFDLPSYLFGVTAFLSPGFQFHYLSESLYSGFIGIDILAVVFFFAVLIVLNEDDNTDQALE